MTRVENAAASVIREHACLGSYCACGADLPIGRLDTPQWFAEHVAEVLAEAGVLRIEVDT